MRWLTLAVFAITLSSCSARWHVNRAIKKDPTILQKDTVVSYDTIVTPPVVLKDTVVLKQIDTLEIFKDKLKVKIFRSFDTIRVDAICDTDTIVSIVEVPVDKIVYKERVKPWQQLERLGLYLIVALFVAKVIQSWWKS